MGITFNGMASGLDTDSITKQLMQIERQPLVKLQQRTSLLNLKKTNLFSINSKLLTFYKASRAMISQVDNVWNQKTSSISNPDVLGVSVTAGADGGTYQIKVNKLAQAHTLGGAKQASSTSALYLSGKIYVNSVEIQIDNTDSLQAIKNKINNAPGTGVTASIIDNTLRIRNNDTGITQVNISDEFAVATKSIQTSDPALLSGSITGNPAPGKYDFVINYLAQRHDVRSDAVADPAAALGLAGTAVINGQTVNVLATDSLNDIKDKLTGAGAGITATVDASNTLRIQSQTWGASGEIVASDTAGNVLQTLGILNPDNVTYKNIIFDARDSDFTVNDVSYSRPENTFNDVIDGVTVDLFGTGTGNLTVDSAGAVLRTLGFLNNDGSIKNELVQAQNAEFEVDGQAVVRSSNVLSDVISNVTLTLKSVSLDPVTLTISKDSSSIKSKIKDWVDSYNAALQSITEKVQEKPVASPKNDSDRAKGTLYNDYLLNQVKFEMRKLLGTPVSGQPVDMQLISQAGININKDGTLSIDDSKLDSVLAADPLKVEQLFVAPGASYLDAAAGLATRIDKYLANITHATNGDIFKSTQTIDKQIDILSTNIAKWEKQLERIEAQYIRKFRAMEQAISAMQGQSKWLSGIK